jgi:DNA-directed RNA polymerase specialized sigma24 family protein
MNSTAKKTARADRHGQPATGAPQPQHHAQEAPLVKEGAAVHEDAAGLAERLDKFDERLARIEAALALLVKQRTVKDFYNTAEVAEELGKAEFTVREWCRHGRVNARKKGSGRGQYQSWVVSHEELLRIRREGLLPLRRD